MPKRKSKEDYEKIEKKIRKLERKLKRRRTSTGTPEPAPPAEPSPEPVLVDSECDTEEMEPIEGTESEKENNLDESILSALGTTSNTEVVYGKEVHTEIIKRIENILKDGISSKEEKEKLSKKFLIPKNALLLEAPKLNIELEGLLSETIKMRDKRVEDRQQLLGSALAAVVNTTDKLIVDGLDKISVIATLSDVARILSELHYQDTLTRRKLIIPNLDKNIINTIESTRRDAYLFGEKFQENVRTATAIKKSANTILKPRTNTLKKIPDRPTMHQKKQENYRAPPRPSFQYKRGGGGRYLQRTPAPNVIPQHQQRHPPVKSYKKPVRQS